MYSALYSCAYTLWIHLHYIFWAWKNQAASRNCICGKKENVMQHTLPIEQLHLLYIYIYTDQYSVYYVGEFSLYLPAIM